MGVDAGEEVQQWPRRSRLLETTRLAQRNRALLVRGVVDGDVDEVERGDDSGMHIQMVEEGEVAEEYPQLLMRNRGMQEVRICRAR